MTVKIKRLVPEAVMPRYAHEGDAGMDICSVEDVLLKPGCTVLVKTGLSLELPAGTEAQVRPRSGLALKHSVTLLNSPGTIDSNYRGELCVIMINHGSRDFMVEKGMRIAQIVIASVVTAEIEECDSLSETGRAQKGFGSSGLK